MADLEYDVAVVGGGPVGLALAGLLGQRGHSVGLFERFAQVFPLPRAIRFDGEAMRVFQNLGIVGTIEDSIVPMQGYRWFGADEEEIVFMNEGHLAPSGWSTSYSFWQPAIDQALQSRAAALATVDMHRGWAAEGLAQVGDGVDLLVRRGAESAPGEWRPGSEKASVRAAYVVGADGANSTVRDAAGIGLRDLGFSESWLVVDTEPDDMSRWNPVISEQHCNPSRPYVEVSSDRRHRRWEFMILPDERPEDFKSEARVWDLLAGHLAPDEGTIVRHAVYEFRSKVAESMNVGRVALAGDAAHVMPPFMGEGLCSGLRDANNLAWRLDLLLRGHGGPGLLDGYSTERGPHNEEMIRHSLEMGRVSCTIDREAAARRDAAFRSGQLPPPPRFPHLESGTLRDDEGDPAAGRLTPQGSVRTMTGVEGRFDDVLGKGFALVILEGDPADLISAGQAEALAAIDAHVVTLDPNVEGSLVDLEGTLAAYLREAGIVAFIARPDGYGFGSATAPEAIGGLVDALVAQLA